MMVPNKFIEIFTSAIANDTLNKKKVSIANVEYVVNPPKKPVVKNDLICGEREIGRASCRERV